MTWKSAYQDYQLACELIELDDEEPQKKARKPKPPASTSSSAACAKVFGIAELAEQILLDLPAQDILCGAQQVCRQWRNAVRHSDLIQQHLFMKPISETALDSDSDLDPGTILENPFLAYLCNLEAQKEAFARPEASWRQMLLCQPPISKAEAKSSEANAELRSISNPQNVGITMGRLAKHVLGELDYVGGWHIWTAYRSTDQLRVVKNEMRRVKAHDAGADDLYLGNIDYDEDFTWMPEHYA